MASRTKLISVQAYDSDGGLDYAIHGSEWAEWYRWMQEDTSPEDIKTLLMAKFEQAVDRAIGKTGFKPIQPDKWGPRD